MLCLKFYEKFQFSAAADTSTNNGSSFWSYGRSAADYTPVLRKYKYQVACKSPQSTKSPDNDPDDPTTFRGEEVKIISPISV